jgi:MOSC domain-containing protein YiiM
VLSVQVGKAAPLGPAAVPSGFVKRPVDGPIDVGSLGLQGDQQADLVAHGGLDKAVYGYSAEHYPRWLEDFPEHENILANGAFGENLTISGLSEDDIYVGDVHEIGTTRLQVCQPRQPCYKFALRFDDRRMPAAMVSSRRSGWYYRVLQQGVIQAGDSVRLVERPHPQLPFDRLVQIVYGGAPHEEELREFARADGVARWIRSLALKALRRADRVEV